MNRTATAPRALALMAEREYTAKDLAEAMGVSLGCAKAAIQRLKLRGKLDRRVDEDGYVHWKAKGGSNGSQ